MSNNAIIGILALNYLVAWYVIGMYRIGYDEPTPIKSRIQLAVLLLGLASLLPILFMIVYREAFPAKIDIPKARVVEK